MTNNSLNDGFSYSKRIKNNKIEPQQKIDSLYKNGIWFANYLKSWSNKNIWINKNSELSNKQVRETFISFIDLDNTFKNILVNGTRLEIQNYIDKLDKEISDFCDKNNVSLEDFYESLMLCIGYIRSDTLTENDEKWYFESSDFLVYFNNKIFNKRAMKVLDKAA